MAGPARSLPRTPRPAAVAGSFEARRSGAQRPRLPCLRDADHAVRARSGDVACCAFDAQRSHHGRHTPPATAHASGDASRQPRAFDLIKCKSLWGTFKEVFVLVYGEEGAGVGVHSLWKCDGERCSNTVISFAQLADANRYLDKVSMNEERSAAVHAITPGRLTRFCTREGYHCQIEMPGSDVSPPEHKLHVSDWERSLQERAAARQPAEAAHDAPDPAAPSTSDRIDDVWASLEGTHQGVRDLPPVPGLYPFRHLARARHHAQHSQPAEPSLSPSSHRISVSSVDSAASSSSGEAPASHPDQPDASGESLALELAALTQRSPHHVETSAFRCTGDANTQARLLEIDAQDVAVVGRGCEDSPLRSRDIDSTTWLTMARPRADTAGARDVPAAAATTAEMARCRHVVLSELASPSGRRTYRFLGREMYLPGMAPTADDPVDLELLEYMWIISGEVGEGRSDGLPAPPS